MEKYALITGASGGIGLEFAHILANDGFDLILVARTLEKLEELSTIINNDYKRKVLVINTDLSIPGSSQALFNQIKERGYIVDVVINNAGFGDNGNFHDTDFSRDIQMINLNITTLYELNKLFVKEMIKRGIGKILNLASVASFMPGPYMALYYATKAFVLNFSVAVAKELEGSGVTVTALCPGPTKSEFFKNANASGKRVSSMFMMPEPKEVALYGYKCMLNGKKFAIHGTSNKVMVFVTRFLPLSFITKIVSIIQKN